MKHEILRIHNYSLEYFLNQRLINISLSIYAGEVIGLQGLAHSGRKLLTKTLTEDIPSLRTKFYVHQKPIFDLKHFRKKVYRMSSENYILGNWAVAEYISMQPDARFGSLYNSRRTTETAQTLLNRFEIAIHPRKKIQYLTEIEKRIIDLIRAYHLGKDIIIIEDEFEACSTSDIQYFKSIMQKVIDDRIAVILNSYSTDITDTLSHRYIIFKNGYIVKKCPKDHIRNTRHLEQFILDTHTTSKIKGLGKERKDRTYLRQEVDSYRIASIRTAQNSPLNLEFGAHEVVSILVMDHEKKTTLFGILTGHLVSSHVTFYHNGEKMQLNSLHDFFQNRIVSIKDLGGREELLLHMSPSENLLIPSLGKFSSVEYLTINKRIEHFFDHELHDQMWSHDKTIASMEINELISVMLERWYIYRPNILILFEPFMNCDTYGVSLVKSYIKKFSDIGTAVLIIKSREEYITDISHTVITL